MPKRAKPTKPVRPTDKRGGGRPSSYTPEVAQVICEQVAAGSNLLRICSDALMPNRDTIYKWLDSNPLFSDNYARAREKRADARFDKMDQVILDMRAGSIDASQARVEIDTLKWQAGKENWKKYGDRQDVNITGTLDVSHRIAETLRRKREQLAHVDIQKALPEPEDQ
jgi:hypothetical protein